jgi:hypothetical protein
MIWFLVAYIPLLLVGHVAVAFSPSQWVYFQFHSDTECLSLIEYVHGVKVDECQSDKKFLNFWNSSDQVTISYKVKVLEDMTTAGGFPLFWLEKYPEENCKSMPEIDIGSLSDFGLCSTIVQDLLPMKYSMMLGRAFNLETPSAILHDKDLLDRKFWISEM